MQWKLTGTREIYLDIADRIENYINAGVYRVGEKLPSVRAAANELSVNPNTVARAYATLEERGLVISIAKKGVFVSDKKGGESAPLSHFADLISELRLLGVSQDTLYSIIEEVYGK